MTMAYRTLEEKFLADYAALEAENAALVAKVAELEARFAERRTSFVLDTAVRHAGRKALFEKSVWKCHSDMSEGFDAWCLDKLNKAPDGVSKGELVEYFADEFERLWDEECVE